MTDRSFTYNRSQFAAALESVGVRRADVVFSHSNVGFFGIPEGERSPRAVFDTILGAFEDVLGPAGTLVVPTFTYSYCRGELFDPGHSPSTCGMFTEMLRGHPRARRSRDPIFSVAALGGRADELTKDAPSECFGPDSFWGRLVKADGILCNLNFDAGSTFVHYVEKQLGVAYRFDKRFVGTSLIGGKAEQTEAVFFCRDLTWPGAARAAFEPLDALGRARGVVRSARVGRGAVVGVRAADLVSLVGEAIKTNPLFLIEGQE